MTSSSTSQASPFQTLSAQKVGLVFGGRSVEHLVSVVSARTVAKGLREAGHEVIPIGVTEDGAFAEAQTSERCLKGELSKMESTGEPVLATVARLTALNVDVFFPIVHGTYGEDGAFQGFAETLNLPYVGPGVLSSAACMDKVVCKRLLADAGIDVVPGVAVSKKASMSDSLAAIQTTLGDAMPLFIKPTVGGSSVGIRKVHEAAELEESLRFAFRFWDEVLVERGVVGRELEIAVLGGETPRASLCGEIVPGRDFYDYEDKYLGDSAELKAPAELAEGVLQRMQACALTAFKAMRGEGMARVDFFLADDKLYINEINTLPGFTAISMYPRLWKETGIALPELCDLLVQDALAKHRGRRTFDDEVRSFVQSIG